MFDLLSALFNGGPEAFSLLKPADAASRGDMLGLAGAAAPAAETPAPQASTALSDPPGMDNRLSAAFQSWANTPVGNPIQGFANLIGGAMTGQRQDPIGVERAQQAELYRALRAHGLDDAIARAAATKSDVLKALIPRLVPGAQASAAQDLPGAAVGAASAARDAGDKPADATAPVPVTPPLLPVAQPNRAGLQYLQRALKSAPPAVRNLYR